MRALSCNHHIDLASKPIADSHTPKTLQALHSPCQFQAPVGSSYKQQKQNTYQPEQGRRGVASCRVLFWPGACLFFCCFGGPGKGALFFLLLGRVACLCVFIVFAVWAGRIIFLLFGRGGGGGGVGVVFLLFGRGRFFSVCLGGGSGGRICFCCLAGGRVFLFAVWAGALFLCCLLFGRRAC